MLSDFTATANAIAATTKKLEKERILADYLRTLDDHSLERAAVFFAGSPFPRRDQRVTGVGAATISDAVAEVTGRTREEVWAGWARFADAGDTIAELFPAEPTRDIGLTETGEYFDRLASLSGALEKKDVLVEMLRRVDREGARYLVKILVGELRIGLQEGLVEAAVARAFDRSLSTVRRANMFTGDIGATALLARADSLEGTAMTLFQPFAFMLAQPEEDPREIFAALGAGSYADDKYDGIRAQIHCSGGEVRIYSRTLDDVTIRFPEVASAAAAVGHDFILDGEIIAYTDRVLPFAVVQKRLGRRRVTEALLRDAPVVFIAFDLLYLDGDAMFETPLRERIFRLQSIVRAGVIRHCDRTVIEHDGQLELAFDAARKRANEGLVIKDPDSVYTPGRRGKAWLKYKKALATLDCAVTYAQYGNGKRRAVLSDLTFAVRKDGEFVNIGKAYSGLTDPEIARLTLQFQTTTIARHGPVHELIPTVVLEIAFDRIQESRRHKSGFALRFPRIARIREDKTIEQVSTIDEVRRIYEGQLFREALGQADPTI